MCCRTLVDLLQMEQEEIALVLRVAGFEGLTDVLYRRDLGEGRTITASLNPTDAGLTAVAFALSPSIGGHSSHEHHVGAPGAAIIFKAGQTLAERGTGRMRQQSLLGACLAEAHTQSLLLAHYP